MFFFEKKEPKTFCLFGPAQGEAGSRLLTKAWEQDFFASFFQKADFLSLQKKKAATRAAEFREETSKKAMLPKQHR